MEIRREVWKIAKIACWTKCIKCAEKQNELHLSLHDHGSVVFYPMIFIKRNYDRVKQNDSETEADEEL